MLHTTRPFRLLLLFGALLALQAEAALAFTTDDVLARLKAQFAKEGVDLAWESASGSGSDIALTGVTVAAKGEDERVPVGNVQLSDVTEENGAYRIGSLALPSYTFEEEGMSVQMQGLAVAGLRLPPENGTQPLDQIAFYDSAKVESATFSIGGKEVFSLANLHMELTAPQGSDPLTFSGGADKFSADLTQVEDQKAKEVLDALGYSTIEGFLEIAGSWAPTDGHLSLDTNKLTVKDAGTLGISFDLSGYTPQLMSALQEMSRKMAENLDDKEKSAQGIAMLGLLQQLTFQGASIRFEDDSLTSKVLAFMAAQQGVQPADMANQAKAVLPFMLAQLNNPEFTKKVTEAVGKFLDDPQSIEISATPASPVPFAMLVAGAMAAPQSLPEQLGVTVTANE